MSRIINDEGIIKGHQYRGSCGLPAMYAQRPVVIEFREPTLTRDARGLHSFVVDLNVLENCPRNNETYDELKTEW
jgi:hypothetical protein